MHLTRHFCFLLLVAICWIPPTALAVVFQQCFEDIRTNKTGQTGGVDSVGNPVSNITEAVGITYNRCLEWCSSAPENFDFPTFSRKFTAWLLPWLALISQLPFNGWNSKQDDVLSVLLAVGSPTLAGYSLALTALNADWLHDCVKRITLSPEPGLEQIERVLNHFQTMRLKIRQERLNEIMTAGGSTSWWENVERGLSYDPQGAVSAATALGWVFFAYLFTVIDAFTSLQAVGDTYGLGPGASPDGVSDGQGVGSIWLWLLPIVIGWLIIAPKYRGDLNNRALTNASRLLPSPIAGPLAQPVNPEHDHDPIFIDPNYHADGTRSAPIFNYARFITWTRDVEIVLDSYKSASNNHTNSGNGCPYIYPTPFLLNLIFQNMDTPIADILVDFWELRSLVLHCSGGLQVVQSSSTGSRRRLV